MVKPKSNGKKIIVAPLAGAWIEIIEKAIEAVKIYVAPLAGAWIEIQSEIRGLTKSKSVAPLAGAWIEMSSSYPHST